MKKLKIIAAIAISVAFIACKGNPQGAMGVNDKPDSTAFDKAEEPKGGLDTTGKDTLNKNIGPGNDKGHVTDSEDKKKHH